MSLPTQLNFSKGRIALNDKGSVVGSLCQPLEFIMSKEIWKSIGFTDNLYQISSKGKIKKNAYCIYSKNGNKCQYDSFFVKSYINNMGYYCVSLNKKSYLLHRLMAIFFIDNPNNKPCVNHINENTKDFSLNNLEWCTHKENMNHGNMIAKRYNTYMTKKIRMKSVVKINLDGEIEKIYVGMREAKREGFDNGSISRVCSGKLKTHKGYRWRYATKEESLQGYAKLKELCDPTLLL